MKLPMVLKMVLLLIATLGTSMAFGQTGQDGKQLIPVKQAAATSGQGRKWAVVVGANEFIDPAIPTLKYCVADAELVVKTLSERCGYDEDHILLIADNQKAHLRPTRRNLQMQVPDWLKHAESGDTVIFFFSGHGFLDVRGQGYLALQDSEKENLGLTALRTDELRELLRQCKASRKLLVLDACHSGGEKGDGVAGSSSQELGASFGLAKGLVTLASCEKGETSREWEAKKHGLFTYFLAEGLTGKADADTNGVVDSDELHNYVLDKVPVTSQKEMNARQTPHRIIGEDVVGRFALAWLAGENKLVPPDARGPMTQRAEVVKEVPPPVVVITSPDRSGLRLDNSDLTVQVKAQAQSGHPIKTLQLLLDDRPYDGDQGRKEFAGDPAGGEEKSASWHVRLGPGRHRLVVIAESDVGEGRSKTVEVIFDEKRVEPSRLYALLVGVADYEDESLKLKYADGDAKLLEDVLRANTAKAFADIPPEIRRFVNRKATKRTFLDGLRWLKDSMRPQDVGIVFFSGHGHRDDDGIFYMLPADVDRRGIDATGLDGTLFKRKLAGIRGRIVVMLDCYADAVERNAGGARQLRPITDDFVREMLQNNSGIAVMCSATGQEESLGDPNLGHGFFTQALTEGLSGRADSNKDGFVYLSELASYVLERVKTLSTNRQHPVIPKPGSVVSFVLSRPSVP
jgi:uncharacterized caspase-like protein